MEQGSLTKSEVRPKMTTQAMPDVLTVAEACEYLRIGKDLLREYVTKGELPVRFIGDRQVFSKRKLLEWVEQAA